MGFPDGQVAYEKKKLELHAKLDQTKKVSPATVSLVQSRLSPQEIARRAQGTKIFKYCTCPAGRVTNNFHSSCKRMHMSF